MELYLHIHIHLQNVVLEHSDFIYVGSVEVCDMIGLLYEYYVGHGHF